MKDPRTSAEGNPVMTMTGAYHRDRSPSEKTPGYEPRASKEQLSPVVVGSSLDASTRVRKEGEMPSEAFP